MKALVCEMCGSQNMVKQEGMYVCQSCGTKYTVDEAKKLFVEGVVKVDNSEELNNLYQLARRAKDENNSENAQKYYEMIVIKDPLSWEATFYSVYFKSIDCKVAEIATAASNVNSVVGSALGLIRDNVETSEEKIKAIQEVSLNAFYIAKILWTAAEKHYPHRDPETGRYINAVERSRCDSATEGIIYNTCNKLVDLFSDDKEVFAEACIPVLKQVLEKEADHPLVKFSVLYKIEPKIVEAIKKYEPDYELPKKEPPKINTNTNSNTQFTKKSSIGCYVATAVYGSYDCPQVWTLRRYRDDTLAKTWYGRLYIHTYYAISPTLVKWFGNTEWFKNMWKPKLDRMVSNLNSKGVENTPYEDKNW